MHKVPEPARLFQEETSRLSPLGRDGATVCRCGGTRSKRCLIWAYNARQNRREGV